MPRKIEADLSIESIHQSNLYGSYKIIEEMDRDRDGCRRFKIKFIDTGYENIVPVTLIEDGNVRDYSYKTDYTIGSIHMSNHCGPFEIISDEGINNKGQRIYGIRFKDTGCEYVVQASQIRTGTVGDIYAKTICGVACKGNISAKEHPKDYTRWKHMIHRCYNPEDDKYSNYGGAGVTVCERWLCFEYYYQDMPNILGYDQYIRNPDGYQLDKDILQQDVPEYKKVYSPETCMFVPIRLNTMYRCNTGANTALGYYGVSRYFSRGQYKAWLWQDGKEFIIGVYDTAELVARAYNCFISIYYPYLPLNPVAPMSVYEMVGLDLRRKQIMCNIVDTNKPKEMCRILK